MQAQKILHSAKRDAQLHHAACNFMKAPGNVYHLYEKSNGKTFFSMLSPDVSVIIGGYIVYYLI